MKRHTLLELVDYATTPAGRKMLAQESLLPDIIYMVESNVCRALPPAAATASCRVDRDQGVESVRMEASWPHLQIVYEFFLRFLTFREVNAKIAEKYVTSSFCCQLIELLDSEDPRERDYLKTILHRLYGKFMSRRSTMRRAISNVFYKFVYETERHSGIDELLQVLGSIINGFDVPIKQEHLQFLNKALIPLHKPKCVAPYHEQLTYCIVKYMDKDPNTAIPILEGFFKYWPWSDSGKQVMFLNELEDILELLGAKQLALVSDLLFTNIGRCLCSHHFQVVERTLFLWNNEHLMNLGCLSMFSAPTVLPIIYGPLYETSQFHWNATVAGLARNILQMYMSWDIELYDRCTSTYLQEEEKAQNRLKAIEDQWATFETIAQTNAASIMLKLIE